MKPAMIYHLVSKYGMFTYVVSYRMSFIICFLKWEYKQDFWTFAVKTQKKGAIFKEESKPP